MDTLLNEVTDTDIHDSCGKSMFTLAWGGTGRGSSCVLWYAHLLAFLVACKQCMIPARLVQHHDEQTVVCYTREDGECERTLAYDLVHITTYTHTHSPTYTCTLTNC
jgi:hypothetical protein